MLLRLIIILLLLMKPEPLFEPLSPVIFKVTTIKSVRIDPSFTYPVKGRIRSPFRSSREPYAHWR